ncbi:MAG: polysaccharide deacetylase family protein [Candidatus Methylomirabilales bacterium]
MKRSSCPSHPARRTRRRCFRCGCRICPACANRVGLRHFCATGCSVIHLMQRAVESEWWVQKCIIRGAPVPARLSRLVRQRQQQLDAQRMRLRTWDSALPGSVFRPALVIRWAPLFIAPLVFLLYWSSHLGVFRYSRLVSVEKPAIPAPQLVRPEVAKPAMPPPEVDPVRTPAPELPEAPGLIPPEMAKPLPFPPEANLSRGPTWERKLCLSFDGGAYANVTAEILDTLKANGIQATMFITGRYIRRNPDLVRRMIEDGHEIGNHTYSHPHLTTFATNGRHDTLPGVTKEFVQDELRQAARVFQQVAGRPISPYWRAPYGEHNREIRQWAAEIGYLHVGWTRDLAAGEDLDTRDWVADPHSPIYYRAEQVRERILNFGKGSAAQANGGIILLHLGTQRKDDYVHRELPVIIDGLQRQGYLLVPVSELHRGLVLGEDGKGSAFAAER